MTIQFPLQCTTRPLTVDDIPAYHRIITAVEIAQYGEALPHNADEIAQELQEAVRSLAVLHDNTLVAVLFLFDQAAHTHFVVDSSIDPQRQGHGIEAAFIQQAEEWVKELAVKAEQSSQVKLHFGIMRPDTIMRQHLQEHNFQLVRSFWRMRIDMTEPPPSAVVPAEFTIRTLHVGDDEPYIYTTVEEAFHDHWEYPESTFAEFQQHYLGTGFDPSLWFVALAGDRVVGTIISHALTGDVWINKVAVQREWRKRGVAMALLRTAFTAYYARGIRRVELGVDADSLTNAQKLYIEAGMHAVMEFDNYRKLVTIEQSVSNAKAAIPE